LSDNTDIADIRHAACHRYDTCCRMQLGGFIHATPRRCLCASRIAREPRLRSFASLGQESADHGKAVATVEGHPPVVVRLCANERFSERHARSTKRMLGLRVDHTGFPCPRTP